MPQHTAAEFWRIIHRCQGGPAALCSALCALLGDRVTDTLVREAKKGCCIRVVTEPPATRVNAHNFDPWTTPEAVACGVIDLVQPWQEVEVTVA